MLPNTGPTTCYIVSKIYTCKYLDLQFEMLELLWKLHYGIKIFESLGTFMDLAESDKCKPGHLKNL